MGIGTLEDEIFRQSGELFSDLFGRYRHSLKGTQCRRVGRYGPNRFQVTRASRNAHIARIVGWIRPVELDVCLNLAGPPFRHPHALIPVSRTMIGLPNFIRANMSKLGFDGVGIP